MAAGGDKDGGSERPWLGISEPESPLPGGLPQDRGLDDGQTLFRHLAEHLPLFIWIADVVAQRVLYATPAIEKTWGLRREAFFEKPTVWMERIHPEDRDRVLGEFQGWWRGGRSRQGYDTRYRMIHPDGSVHWLHARIRGESIPGQEVRYAIGIVEDVTERWQTMEALRESEEKYRHLIEHAPAGIYEVDLRTGRFVSVNDVLCEYTGYSREELLHMTPLQLLTEESRERFLKRLQGTLAGEDVPDVAQFEWVSKQGRRSWLLIRRKVLYEEGKPVRLVVVAHDITERKQLEEEIQKAQRLESLGILAGGIAHDFNNILAAILGNLSLAGMEPQLPERVGFLLSEAERACSRAKALTQQLLTFSKGGAPVKAATSLAELLAESAAFALRGSRARCLLAVAPDLWPADVDEGQISQVVHNLMINADQAMPGGGTIHVRGENAIVEEDQGLPLRPGRYVHIAVADQGAGIPPEHLGKIFDPYFTTKASGSGLGLATSYAIMKRHEGHISVASRPGEGTIFHLYLPASDSPPPAPNADPGPAPAGEGRILLMDDDEQVRRVAEAMLRHLGYDVVPARDGEEAMALFTRAQEEGKAFHALIVDLTVPGGMGGAELVERLRVDHGTVRAIVSSGYSTDPVMAEHRERGFSGVVAKPYRLEELARVLREVLGQPG
jgi:PAS domain S-box-containing protein